MLHLDIAAEFGQYRWDNMRLWKVNMGMTVVGNVCSISLAIDAIQHVKTTEGTETTRTRSI